MMDLRRGALLLAALCVSGSALTPEECKPLLTPLTLDGLSVMYGRWNFLAGYVDNEAYLEILKKSESSWMKNSPSPNPNEVLMSQENRINGTCMASNTTATIEGDTASVSLANTTSVFQLLPGCDGCLVLNISSTSRNLDKLLQQMNFSSSITGDQIVAHSFYLMGREATLKDSDLQLFRQQASCLGFSREPDFLYDPKNGFCAEGEGVKITG